MNSKKLNDIIKLLSYNFNIKGEIIKKNDTFCIDFIYKESNQLPVLFQSGINSDNIDTYTEFFNYLIQINQMDKESISINITKDNNYNITWDIYYKGTYIEKADINYVKRIYDSIIQEKKDFINNKIKNLNFKIQKLCYLINNYLEYYQNYMEIINNINKYKEKIAIIEKKKFFRIFKNFRIKKMKKELFSKINNIGVLLKSITYVKSIELYYDNLFTAENIFSKIKNGIGDNEPKFIPSLSLNTDSINNVSYINNIFSQLDRLNILIDKKIAKFNQSIAEIKKNITDVRNQTQNKQITNLPECLNYKSLLNESENIPLNTKEENTYNVVDYYNKNLFNRIQLEQSKILNRNEKIAVLIYKTQLYRAFNPLLTLINKLANNDFDLAKDLEKNISNIPEFNTIIEQAYNEMVEEYKKNKSHKKDKSRNEVTYIIDDILPPNRLISFERYKKIIIDYFPHLITALQKFKLPEDLIVYRGVNTTDETILNNGFLSTTLYPSQTLQFIESRPMENKKKIIYKILLPKGSPAVCFTTELFTGWINESKPFDDAQKEILINPDLYSFEIINVAKGINLRSDSSSNNINNVTIITLEAIPKMSISNYEKKNFTK